MLLVFGSINVDLLFRVEALPRPGETVLCPSYEVAAGGKGANQATAAARGGATVRMIGHVGDDGFGHFARQALAGAGVDCTHVLTSGMATGVAVIGVDRAAENQIIVASGANRDTHAGQVADADLAPGVTLLCQNEVPPEATFALLERAKARGARTILNLAPAGAAPPRVLRSLDVLVVNEVEGRAAAGLSEAADVAAFAGDLAQRHRLTCVVTLGARGRARDRTRGRSARRRPAGRTGGYHGRRRRLRRSPRRSARSGPRTRYGIAARERCGRAWPAPGWARRPANRRRPRSRPGSATCPLPSRCADARIEVRGTRPPSGQAPRPKPQGHMRGAAMPSLDRTRAWLGQPEDALSPPRVWSAAREHLRRMLSQAPKAR